MVTGDRSSPTMSSLRPSSTGCCTTPPPSTSRARATGSRTRRRLASSPLKPPTRKEPPNHGPACWENAARARPQPHPPTRSKPSTRPKWGIFKRPYMGIFQLTMTRAQSKKPFSGKHLRERYTQGAKRFGWSKRKPEPRSMWDGVQLLGWGMAPPQPIPETGPRRQP